MIISLKELNKFMSDIKLDVNIEKVINSIGYEVESITKFSDVEGVKIGKVLDVSKNENSKNLWIVKLQTKDGETTIQTTATNATVGCYTVFFPVGAKKGDIVFAAKTMAGIESRGMMAGFNELGYDASKLPFNPDDLIMTKEKGINLETDPVSYFGLDDYIIDVTTPANRSDINSYYVLGQEIAAYYGTKFHWISDKELKVDFKSKLNVNRGLAKELSFIESKINKSHTPLQDILFLARHGVEAKNNYVIDLTNLNLILTGAPTHAYDRDLIDNEITCIDYSGNVTLLGNKDVEVKNVLAIKDNEKVISLGCVMGCESSAVTQQSRNIAFEIGNFDSKLVRHGAKEIKLDSASSIQGGRGVNRETLIIGMKYLAHRLKKDNNLISNFINLPKSKKGTPVIQNRKKLALYANCDVKDLKKFKDVEQKLETIGFGIQKNRIVAPAYRSDISNFEDIIEEYFRFYGYDNFKPIAPKLDPFKVGKSNLNKNSLQAMGYQEIRTFTLTDKEQAKFNPFGYEKTIELETFVSKEREAIRNSIIPSMLEAAEYNLKRRIDDINFFENGMINNNEYVYGIVTNEKSFNELKRDVFNILRTKNIQFMPFSNNQFIHPNVSAKIMLNNEMIGWIGKVHPNFNKIDVFVAEFKDIHSDQIKEFEDYDHNPLKSIDLTFNLQLNENIDNTITRIKSVAKIFKIKQIDKFIKDSIKAVTLRVFSTNEEIDKINKEFNK
ncbi:phenylalanine--tRNA ligase subunit beta [Mycoplasma sp. Mirounga ES2805-ORL]|uniref:phenylalanine--tRNA ligase subunit beta n=1 Tax=Mycoplasma sp. Mirounga ES2805-ORL TaxID=754514 RepID=UPI00197BA95B|nr:phenylalanine--tRNA ligase subunit beta [Mycoplasma sp. Mirounga ES2805-ORL]QSF13675.1 phenylalanine--tRNA ligase subunit beta [Mycoplasma sp. Mirounga ES2805-ORL]